MNVAIPKAWGSEKNGWQLGTYYFTRSRWSRHVRHAHYRRSVHPFHALINNYHFFKHNFVGGIVLDFWLMSKERSTLALVPQWSVVPWDEWHFDWATWGFSIGNLDICAELLEAKPGECLEERYLALDHFSLVFWLRLYSVTTTTPLRQKQCRHNAEKRISRQGYLR